MIFRDEIGNVVNEGDIVGVIAPVTLCKIEKLAPPVLNAQGQGVAQAVLSAIMFKPANDSGVIPGVIAVKFPNQPTLPAPKQPEQESLVKSTD